MTCYLLKEALEEEYHNVLASMQKWTIYEKLIHKNLRIIISRPEQLVR